MIGSYLYSTDSNMYLLYVIGKEPEKTEQNRHVVHSSEVKS